VSDLQHFQSRIEVTRAQRSPGAWAQWQQRQPAEEGGQARPAVFHQQPPL
jgi:hypothetical protein